MSEDEIVETAKAIQEASKLGAKSVDGARELGSFFNRVFGDIAEDTVGFVADHVRYMRIQRAAKLQQKVSEQLAARGVEQTRPVSPVIGLPILEAATLEEDDDLHTGWANLLASAMDPSRPEVKRSFSGILSQLEGKDALLFNKIVKATLTVRFENEARRTLPRWKEEFGVNDADFDVSFGNLVRVGLITITVEQTALRLSSGNPRGLPEFGGVFSVSALGFEFYDAVLAS